MAQTSVVSLDKCVGLFSTQQADLEAQKDDNRRNTRATVEGEPGGGGAGWRGAGGRRRYEQLTQHPRNTPLMFLLSRTSHPV